MPADQLMPPMHADTIRACGVGLGAHHFLHAHMGARPVVVVEVLHETGCACCGEAIAAGERALRFTYSFDSVNESTAHLHPRHCARETAPSHVPEFVARAAGAAQLAA